MTDLAMQQAHEELERQEALSNTHTLIIYLDRPDSGFTDLDMADITSTIRSALDDQPGVVIKIPQSLTVVTTFKQVGAMMKAYGQTINTVPTWPSEKDYTLRVRLDVEEAMEKFHLGYYYGNALQILDGSCDTDVVMTGADHTFGFDHDAAIAEVTRSNMSKLTDGVAVKDSHGKVIKPPTYSPPNLLPFVGDLANTKPDYDTAALVREAFTEVLAKRHDMIDFPLLFKGIAEEKERRLAAAEGREPNLVAVSDFIGLVEDVAVAAIDSKYGYNKPN